MINPDPAKRPTANEVVTHSAISTEKSKVFYSVWLKTQCLYRIFYASGMV